MENREIIKHLLLNQKHQVKEKEFFLLKIMMKFLILRDMLFKDIFQDLY